MEILKASLLVVMSILNVILGVTIYIRNPRKLTNILFLLITINLAGWATGNAAFLYAHDYVSASIIATLFYIFPLICAHLFVLLALAFPNENKINKPIALLSLTMVLVIVAPLLYDNHILFKTITFENWGVNITLRRLPYLFYGFNILCPIILSTIILRFKYRTLTDVYRKQAKILVSGLLLALLVGAYFNLILPWYGNYRLIWVGPNCMGIYFCFCLYSILKHRLFGLRIYIIRGVMQTALLFLFFIVFTGILASSELLMFGGGSLERFLIYWLVISVALLFYPASRTYTIRAVSKAVYHDSIDSKMILPEITNIGVKASTAENYIGQFAEVLLNELSASYVVVCLEGGLFYTAGKSEWNYSQVKYATKKLHSHADDVVLVSDENDSYFQRIAGEYMVAVISKVSVSQKITGVVLVGERTNGQSYSGEDIRTIKAATEQLTLTTVSLQRMVEIRDFNSSLEDRILTATKDLKLKNRQLHEADAVKDEFISMASHQLLPQITGSKGLIETLPKHDEVLTMIHSSLGRMEMLVHDMLNVGRLRNGNLMLHRTTFNLVQTVYAEIRSLEYFAKKSSVHITFEHEETVMDIKADEDKLREVVFNLIENAIAYSDTGSKVTINLFKRGSGYVFEIQDKGIGISPKEISKIFDIFYRSDVAKQKRPTGTGIGLYVSKKILDAHQYPLEVSSGQGKGTKIAIMMTQDIEVKKRQE